MKHIWRLSLIHILDKYIANEDWKSYAAYIDVNELYYSGINGFDDYRYFQRMVTDYNYIYDACMHLVDHENIDNEYMYYTPDRCMEEIADNLKDMYDFVKADEYSIYYEVYQNHSDWCDTVLTQAEELVQAYAGAVSYTHLDVYKRQDRVLPDLIDPDHGIHQSFTMERNIF